MRGRDRVGPVALALALVWGVGRVKFCVLYKEDVKRRGAGFLLAMVAEHVSAALVLLVGLKGTLGDNLPLP